MTWESGRSKMECVEAAPSHAAREEALERWLGCGPGNSHGGQGDQEVGCHGSKCSGRPPDPKGGRWEQREQRGWHSPKGSRFLQSGGEDVTRKEPLHWTEGTLCLR